MPQAKIQVGQIGYGYWGAKLFRYFDAHPGFNVKTIAVRDVSKDRDGIKWNLVVNSYDKILSDPKIKAVIVATPPSEHFHIGKLVLESGKHLFIEKPFTRKTYEASGLKAIADSKGLKILVDYTFTFSAAIAQMRDMINSGEIGEVSAISMIMRQLGVFVNEDVYDLLGSHMLSVLNMLVPLEEFDFLKHDLLHRRGTVEGGTMTFSQRGKELSGEILLSVNHPQKERSIAVYGERGTILYDMFAKAPLSLTLYSVGQGSGDFASGVVQKDFPQFREDRNIALAVDYFHRLLLDKVESNANDAIMVRRTLERARHMNRRLDLS